MMLSWRHDPCTLFLNSTRECPLKQKRKEGKGKWTISPYNKHKIEGTAWKIEYAAISPFPYFTKFYLVVSFGSFLAFKVVFALLEYVQNIVDIYGIFEAYSSGVKTTLKARKPPM